MPRIPFADVTFPNQGASTRYEIENRLKQFIVDYRKNACALGNVYPVTERDRATIQRRSEAYIAATSRASGMSHLDKNDRAALEVFRGGAELVAVETEHRADEIASALHTDMPWMAQATEKLWQGMRSSVRRGDPAPQIAPLLLVGPPGIGNSHWARLLGDLMHVPTTVIEATNEPASFSITGSQRGWASCEPGKPLQTIIAHSIANPIVVDHLGDDGEQLEWVSDRSSISFYSVMRRATCRQKR
ncbi:hypothetical protein [Pacificibacter marinus]|uniref:Uncharacterized protein n=1 Tax=Pacificibacter marinus TaxID=658057 RepID=A0A1Y5SCV9_9RHOB|nr:hypothetical protein [Pacificibacter marinus]SEK50933.1 hypothetical protein SAMN04488032_103108 [Pacificibacter marinus]SLN37714.1 hypothetical protein PAM7971_01661 [Pacificibacter marinus]